MLLSPELLDAVNHVQSHAHQMRAIIAIADAVMSIKALEQAANEAENRKAAVEKTARDAEAAHKSVLIAIEAANADLAQTRKAITAAESKATEAADEIKAKAQTEAGRIIDEARAGIAKAVADEQAKLDWLRAEVRTHTAALTAGGDERRKLEAEVADLEARADKARAYLAKLTKD